MKKKLLSLLLAVVLCLGMVPSALADVTNDPVNGPQAPVETPVRPPEPQDPTDTGTSDSGSSPSNISVRSGGGASHGTVSCSPSDAKKGDTVTVTARPKDGYRADSIIVRDSKGNVIEVKQIGENKFTFVMPAGRVTVTPVFVRIGSQAPAATTFTDVPADAYYAAAVAWAVEKGITTGTTATTFSPNASCTRAQTVTFLWRAAGSPAPKSETNPFTDVNSGAYYYQAVLWAVERGITTGTTATTFSPDATVTRAQTVTFMYRAAGSPEGGSSSPFTDVVSDAYYAGAVQWAVGKGITSGTTATTFSPGSNCTRAQIVTFLYRGQ